MDPSRVKVKKLPLKLFGSINDNLRFCCLELFKDATVSDILLVGSILERVIHDYVNRKMEKENTKVRVLQVEENTKVDPIIETHQFTKNLRIRPKQKPHYSESDNHWEDACKLCG